MATTAAPSLESLAPGDSLGRLNAALAEFLARHYPTAIYSAVIVHLADGVPDVVLPVQGGKFLPIVPD